MPTPAAPQGAPPPRVQRIVLLGLPGAGKSTVGAELAARLGWHFLDIDEEIVRRTGQSVAEIFARAGAAAFRRQEAELTAEACALEGIVVAPGGGWAAQPGSIEALPAGTALVWLRVTPGEAIRRLRGSPVQRPLVAGADPLGALVTLLRQREARYGLAHVAIDADRAPDAVAHDIIEWLNRSTS